MRSIVWGMVLLALAGVVHGQPRANESFIFDKDRLTRAAAEVNRMQRYEVEALARMLADCKTGALGESLDFAQCDRSFNYFDIVGSSQYTQLNALLKAAWVSWAAVRAFQKENRSTDAKLNTAAMRSMEVLDALAFATSNRFAALKSGK